MKKLAFPLMLMLFSATAFAQKNVAVLEIDLHPDLAKQVSRGDNQRHTQYGCQNAAASAI